MVSRVKRVDRQESQGRGSINEQEIVAVSNFWNELSLQGVLPAKHGSELDFGTGKVQIGGSNVEVFGRSGLDD